MIVKNKSTDIVKQNNCKILLEKWTVGDKEKLDCVVSC